MDVLAGPDTVVAQRDHVHLPRQGGCESPDPANTVTDRLNALLRDNRDGYVLRLCPKQRYFIQAPIAFTHPKQEISTLGDPTGDDRAVLAVTGPVANGLGHTVAIDATCATCEGVKIKNIQVWLPFLSPVPFLIVVTGRRHASRGRPDQRGRQHSARG